MATASPCPDEPALQALEVVVRRAFAIEGGYRELSGVVQAATGEGLFDVIGQEQGPMKTVVETLRARAVATGMGERLLAGLFTGLPGNVELREWVARHCPALLPRVSDAAFEAARTAYETDRMNRRVWIIQTQLTAIGASVRLRGEHRALARLVIEKLDELTDYKKVHDALHGLQMEVLVELTRLARPDILPADRAESLGWQVERLQSAIEKIEGRFRGAGEGAVSASLCRKVVTALRQIVAVLADGSPDAVEAGAGLLRALLRQQMSLFDSKLVEASDAIPFQRFADVLRALPQPTPPPSTAGTGAAPGLDDPVMVSNLGDGFSDIEARLVRRRTVHGLWQQVESTLLNIEELLRGTGRAIELQVHWQNLEELIAEIAGFSAELGLLLLPRPEGLAEAAGGMPGTDAEALADAVRAPAFAGRFGAFAGKARVRFQRVDTALVNDCETLKLLQRPLEAMLED